MLIIISLSLILVSVTAYAAQDYIKENPELDRLLANGSPQDRDALNKMLSSMSPDRRQRFIQGMIDVGLKIERDAIIVESVFGKFHKGPDGQKGLVVNNDNPPAPGQKLLTDAELAQLAALPLNGTLEEIGHGKRWCRTCQEGDSRRLDHATTCVEPNRVRAARRRKSNDRSDGQ
jgi:hypothetical protein